MIPEWLLQDPYEWPSNHVYSLLPCKRAALQWSYSFLHQLLRGNLSESVKRPPEKLDSEELWPTSHPPSFWPISHPPSSHLGMSPSHHPPHWPLALHCLDYWAAENRCSTGDRQCDNFSSRPVAYSRDLQHIWIPTAVVDPQWALRAQPWISHHSLKSHSMMFSKDSLPLESTHWFSIPLVFWQVQDHHTNCKSFHIPLLWLM